MIYTRSGADALANRYEVVSPGTGNKHWGTTFFGNRVSKEVAPGPQATMSELQAHEAVVPHFHGVTMYQLFIAGSGTIGNRGQVLEPLTVQFKDHHTAYGPLTAGPQGLRGRPPGGVTLPWTMAMRAPCRAASATMW